MLKKFLFYPVFYITAAACSLISPADRSLVHHLPAETDMPGWRYEAPPSAVDISKENFLPGPVPTEAVEASFALSSDKTNKIKVSIMKFSGPLEAFSAYTLKKGYESERPELRPAGNFVYSDSKGTFAAAGRYNIAVLHGSQRQTGAFKISDIITAVTRNLNVGDEVYVLPEWFGLFATGSALDNMVYSHAPMKETPFLSGFCFRIFLFEGSRMEVFYKKSMSQSDAENFFYSLMRSGAADFIMLRDEGPRLIAGKTGEGRWLTAALHKDIVFGLLDADTIIRGRSAAEAMYAYLLSVQKPGKIK